LTATGLTGAPTAPVTGIGAAVSQQQHGAPGDDVRDGLDAGDGVAEAGHDVAGRTAVPGDAVVEDVAQVVPLRGALQRHGDDVVGAAQAVRERAGPTVRPCPSHLRPDSMPTTRSAEFDCRAARRSPGLPAMDTAELSGCVIVTGMPGAGKSTVTRLAAQRLPKAAQVSGDADQRRDLTDRGWWFDTSALTPAETADRLVREVSRRAPLL
jgi:hypothetical protein